MEKHLSFLLNVAIAAFFTSFILSSCSEDLTFSPKEELETGFVINSSFTISGVSLYVKDGVLVIPSLADGIILKKSLTENPEQLVMFEARLEEIEGFTSSADAYEMLEQTQEFEEGELEKYTSVVSLLTEADGSLVADYAISDPVMRILFNENGMLQLGEEYYYHSKDGAFLLPGNPNRDFISEELASTKDLLPATNLLGTFIPNKFRIEKSSGGNVEVIQVFDEGTFYYGTRRRGKFKFYEKESTIDDPDGGPFEVVVQGFAREIKHQRKSGWNGIWWSEKADELRNHAEFEFRRLSTNNIITITACDFVQNKDFFGPNTSPARVLDLSDVEERFELVTARITHSAQDGGGFGQGITIEGGPLSALPASCN